MAATEPNPRPDTDDSLIQGRHWWSARLERWIGAKTPNCRRVVRLISDSLERPPDWRTRLTLHAHYLVCCYCRRYEQQAHLLRRFTISLPQHIDEVMPERLEEAVKQRIKECLRACEK